MSEDYKHIDDLFKDKFENFEQDPPAHIWENVKAGIAPGGSSKGGIKGGLAGFTVLLVIIGTLLVYLLNNAFTIQQAEEAPQTEKTIENNVFADNQQVNNIASQNSNLITNNQTNQSAIESSSSNTGKQIQQKENIRPDYTSEVVPKQKIAKSSLIVSGKDPDETENTFSNTTTDQSLIELNNLTYIKFEEIGSINNSDKDFKLNSKISDFGSVVPAVAPADYGPKGEWLIGLYFRPEMIRYPADNKVTNYSNGIDLHLHYRKNNLFIQTGIGYSRVKDAGNYHIDYNKYLGSYEDVYDVTFDTIGNQVIPTYHTNTVDVYDSVNYVRISPSERVFGYLDIPVLIGFGQDYRRFGWFIKAGPALSLKIHENIPSMDMSEDQFKILNVENSLPARLKANWQFAFSAGINYKLGNRISLTVEPLIRYYINSDYERGKFTTKHPYSLGLRTGLLMSF